MVSQRVLVYLLMLLGSPSDHHVYIYSAMHSYIRSWVKLYLQLVVSQLVGAHIFLVRQTNVEKQLVLLLLAQRSKSQSHTSVSELEGNRVADPLSFRALAQAVQLGPLGHGPVDMFQTLEQVCFVAGLLVQQLLEVQVVVGKTSLSHFGVRRGHLGPEPVVGSLVGTPHVHEVLERVDRPTEHGGSSEN